MANATTDPNVLAVLQEAFAALQPAELTKISAGIKKARKSNRASLRGIEDTLREMGDALVISDPSSAETFFYLSEMLAVAREKFEKKSLLN